MDNRKKNLIIGLVSLLFLILISISIGSLSFTTSPSISPSTAYTDDNLNCSWQASPDTTQTNVSWYKDGVLFSNTTTSQNYPIRIPLRIRTGFVM